jgi:hypothetical protein
VPDAPPETDGFPEEESDNVDIAVNDADDVTDCETVFVPVKDGEAVFVIVAVSEGLWLVLRVSVIDDVDEAVTLPVNVAFGERVGEDVDDPLRVDCPEVDEVEDAEMVFVKDAVTVGDEVPFAGLLEVEAVTEKEVVADGENVAVEQTETEYVPDGVTVGDEVIRGVVDMIELVAVGVKVFDNVCETLTVPVTEEPADADGAFVLDVHKVGDVDTEDVKEPTAAKFADAEALLDIEDVAVLERVPVTEAVEVGQKLTVPEAVEEGVLEIEIVLFGEPVDVAETVELLVMEEQLVGVFVDSADGVCAIFVAVSDRVICPDAVEDAHTVPVLEEPAEEEATAVVDGDVELVYDVVEQSEFEPVNDEANEAVTEWVPDTVTVGDNDPLWQEDADVECVFVSVDEEHPDPVVVPVTEPAGEYENAEEGEMVPVFVPLVDNDIMSVEEGDKLPDTVTVTVVVGLVECELVTQWEVVCEDDVVGETVPEMVRVGDSGTVRVDTNDDDGAADVVVEPVTEREAVSQLDDDIDPVPEFVRDTVPDADTE